jgi:hypothetical protein
MPDTDVLVLLVHYFSRMSNTSDLWFQTGTITALKDDRRYISVDDMQIIVHCTVQNITSSPCSYWLRYDLGNVWDWVKVDLQVT